MLKEMIDASANFLDRCIIRDWANLSQSKLTSFHMLFDIFQIRYIFQKKLQILRMRSTC